MKIYENPWTSEKIDENPWKSMKIHENPWTSMKINRKTIKIYGNLWKSMNMYEIYLFWKTKMRYILYSKKKSHISVLRRETNCLNRENENWCFRERMDFDMHNTCQSDIFYENLKWSHAHYDHFAPDGFPQNHDTSVIFDGSVEIHFIKSLGLISVTISNDFT